MVGQVRERPDEHEQPLEYLYSICKHAETVIMSNVFLAQEYPNGCSRDRSIPPSKSESGVEIGFHLKFDAAQGVGVTWRRKLSGKWLDLFMTKNAGSPA